MAPIAALQGGRVIVQSLVSKTIGSAVYANNSNPTLRAEKSATLRVVGVATWEEVLTQRAIIDSVYEDHRWTPDPGAFSYWVEALD